MTKKKIEKIKQKVLDVMNQGDTFESDMYDYDNYVSIWKKDETFKVQITKHGMSTGFSKDFSDFDSAFDNFIEEVEDRDFKIVLY